jgi:hypothetical protein
VNSTLKQGAVLGLLVSFWTLLMGVTDWYKHPTLMNLFWIVILIQIGVLIWSLRSSSHREAGFWGQVKAGSTISLIGACIIFIGSYLFTSVIFPHYFEEMKTMGEEVLKSKGMTDVQIQAALEAQAPMQTSFMQALFGFIGTVVTGPIVSMALAILPRKNKR